MRPILAAALILAAVAPGAAARAATDCPWTDPGTRLVYVNARYGFAMAYPSIFVLDPGSVPANGDSARFWTADRQATAVVNAAPNAGGQSLAEAMEEAEQDILQNVQGEITYRRSRDNWFVISGIMAGRIFYRRTLLTRDAAKLATLWIEFPRALRPCLDEAVTMMSLSFRER
jgi:hypothetical protein